jgi:glutamyl-Q tRNA(Asp) synthetase
MRSRSASSTGEQLETGRFAPSPTGPLHLGSLLTAVASWINVRAVGGRWILRIEDLDTPRCVPGAADAILRSLERHGLHWDELSYQHHRSALYRSALERLTAQGHTYPCTCSRSQLPDGGIYPGTCRSRVGIHGASSALRLRVGEHPIEIHDAIQGHFSQRLDRDVGDFIVHRRDGIIAYQLAVVVDDIEQHVTQVVRGADLLDNTPRQLWLYRLMDAPVPSYAHVSVLTDRSRHKLSKLTHATSLDAHPATANLQLILGLLGHPPPRMLRFAAPRELLEWAILDWDISRLPRGIVHPGFVCI